MASFLFTCVKCLGVRRLSSNVEGFVPPADFDNICDECKAAAKVPEKRAPKK